MIHFFSQYHTDRWQVYLSRSWTLKWTPLLIISLFISTSVNAHNKLVVAFSELPPYKMVHKGKFIGPYAELSREIAKILALDVEFKLCSLKRCLRLMENGAADMIIGVKHAQSRQRYIQFLSTPYRSSIAKVFYLRMSEHRPLATYDDLYNFEHIGVKSGAKYFAKFDSDNYLQKVSVSTNSQNFAKLTHRRINTMIINAAQGEYLVQTLGLQHKVKQADFTINEKSFRYVGISKRSIHMLNFQDFEKAMLSIVDSGLLNCIMAKARQCK